MVGRVLGHDGSHDLVADGRQYLLVVVLAQVIMDLVEFPDLGVEKHPQRDPDVLHVSIGSLAPDFLLTRLDIVDDGLLQDGDLEVVALTVDLRGQPRQFIELDGIVPDVN